jgi:hypothetical protein
MIPYRHGGRWLTLIAGCLQAQFGFFARAIPFLRAATDGELRRTVADYTQFLADGARGCPKFGVELVWRTHLLMPKAYAEDCVALAGRLIDHTILPAASYSLAATAAVELPLRDELSLAHLVGAVRRQQSFMEKMLARRSVIATPDHLALCVQQYCQYLALMKRHRGAVLVPTLAIDLMCVRVSIPIFYGTADHIKQANMACRPSSSNRVRCAAGIRTK